MSDYPAKVKIISLHVDVIGYDQALYSIVQMAKNQSPGFICFANVHMTVEAYKRKEFADEINAATMVLTDGMPLVKWVNLRGSKHKRIAGMDFMPSIIEACAREKLSIFFFGSSQEVLNGISAKIHQDHPNLKIAGALSPSFHEFTNEEAQSYVRTINEAQPNLILVGLGCPKQERWMARYSKKISAPMLGVGGAFSVYAGLTRRAPDWMQRLSLEWLYRLMQEPRRMWKRYLITNTIFIKMMAKEYFRLKMNRDYAE